MEGEFTKGVLTMVAKYAKPEMASRLAHGPQQVGSTHHCRSKHESPGLHCSALLSF